MKTLESLIFLTANQHMAFRSNMHNFEICVTPDEREPGSAKIDGDEPFTYINRQGLKRFLTAWSCAGMA